MVRKNDPARYHSPGCVSSSSVKRECRFLRGHFLPMKRAGSLPPYSLPTLTKLPSPSFYRTMSRLLLPAVAASHRLSMAVRDTVLQGTFGYFTFNFVSSALTALRQLRKLHKRGPHCGKRGEGPVAREPCRNNSGHSYYILAASANSA